MKRILSFLLALTLVFSMIPSVAVQAATSGDYTYTVEKGEATITGYTGAGGDITIPSMLGGYLVTVIGDEAFSENDSLTAVTIPDSVTTIGAYAFYYCESLTNVVIGRGMMSINNAAFHLCHGLTGIWINEDNPYYSSDDRGVLFNKDKTELVLAPGGILGAYCIPGGVTSIGDYAFNSCRSLTSIIIPDGVITIGQGAVCCCINLTSLTIGNDVISIGESAFENAESLTLVTIPASVTSIGAYAFVGCNSLKDVHYGGTEDQWNAISIEDHNEDLTSATIHFAEPEVPENTDYTYTVENGEATIASYNGEGGDITIPSTLGGYPVTTIGKVAFWEESGLTSVVIPDSVITIGVSAFQGCENLTSVTIGDGVTTIGNSAFMYCFCLKDVTFGSSVTTIGNCAFAECIIKTVDIPEGVTTIGDSAFELCGTNLVTIPASVTSIGSGAFNNWSRGPSFSVADDNPVYCSDSHGTLFNKEKTTLIQASGSISGEYTVPDTVTVIGDDAFLWNPVTVVILPADVTVGDYAFDSCQNLTTVIFKGEATIGNYTFDWCPKLDTVLYCVIDPFTAIGERNEPFRRADWFKVSVTETVQPTCTEDGYILYSSKYASYRQVLKAPGQHTEQILPAVEPTEAASGLTEGKKCSVCGEILTAQEVVPMLAYYTYTVANGEATITGYTGNGGNITIPDTLGGYPVTAIGGSAFFDCDSLTSVTIPDSVTIIGSSAFMCCYNLTSVTIGNSVAIIGSCAFEYCRLTSVTIPDSVTTIDDYAFFECGWLTDVYYGDTEEQWNAISIGDYNESLLNATIYFSEHTHRLTSVVTAPTCTEVGYTTYACSSCDYSYTDDYVLALGHTEETIPAVAPTCEGTGLTEGKKCTACGKTFVAQKTVAALGHNYESKHFDAADGMPGYTRYTCSRCGDTYTDHDAFCITTQPVNEHKAKGKIATFTVVAEDAVSYQWQRIKQGATKWTNITGATEASYCVTVSSSTIIPYRCVLTDAQGNQLITDEVTIIEPAPQVKITNTAGNQHVIKNTSISFTVELDSTEGVTYQWQRCKNGSTWTNVSYTGNQTKTVTFDAASWAQFPFRCEITDANGTKIYTDSYTYTLVEPPVAPAITSQPKDYYVLAGGTATFSVTAVGSDLTYQWWRSKDGGTTYGQYTGTGGKTSSISLKVYSGQEYLYMCEVKDGYGNTLKTKVVQPHLIAAVKITAQPTVVVEDGKATFSFTATGDVRTYQWERLKSNGWVNANSSSYEGFNTTTMSTTVTGTFRCRITDLAGNVTYTRAITFTK